MTLTRKAWRPCWCWEVLEEHLNVRCYVDEILVPRFPIHPR